MDTLQTTTRWEACCPACAGDVLEVADRTAFLLCVDCGWPMTAPAGPRRARRTVPTAFRPAARHLEALAARLGVFALARGQVQ